MRYNRKHLRAMQRKLKARKKQPWCITSYREVTTMDGKTFTVKD